MKKKHLVTLALAFAALTLSACGSSTPGGGGDSGRPDSSEITLDFMTFIKENNISFENQTLAYTGAPQTIEISGTLPQGYRVYYTGGDKVDVGTYPVQAHFKGPGLPDSKNDFLEALMTIVPGAVDESKIIFGDATYVFDDEYHSLEVARPYPEGIVDVTYSGANFYDAGTYEVTAYFEVDRNHAPVDPRTATLTILPYEVDMSGVVFEDKTVTFDGNFHSIYADNLPEGVEVEYEGNYKKDAGVYTVTANFIAPLNAAPIDPMTATLTIDKAPFDVSSFSFPDQEARYDGQTHPIALEGTLPNGLKVIYENNENIELGEHEVTAHFAWDDSYQYVQNLKNNYLLPADMKATLTIIKGIPAIEFNDLSVPYDEQAHSITIEGDLPEGITVEYTNNGQTKAGEYEITAHFSGTNDHYECPEDMKATLYIEDDYEGLVYEQVDDHYAVVGVFPWEGDTVLNIPAVYDGLPVKEVSFSYWSDAPFEKLFVHGDLDSFSMQGFFPKLQSAHFYGDVTAFESLHYCHALTEILFDGTVKAIATNAFTEVDALETITLPDGLETIGNYAFSFCRSLKTIHFPSGLTSIGEYAFKSCGLEAVSLPESLTSLGNNVFEDCESLASVSYGSKITSIANETFRSCTALKRINSSTDGVFDLGEHVTSLGIRALYQNEHVTTILAPNLAGIIDEYSFENLPNLSRVEVGDAVTEISHAFSNVPDLESFNSLVPGEIVLPASTQEVITSFNGCEKIKSVVFNAALTSVYASFRDSPQVTEVTLPASVVGFDSFNASPLVNFVAPGITENDYSKLNFQASALRSLTAPSWVLCDLPAEARANLETVTVVGNNAIPSGYLSGCTNLKTLRLEVNLTSPESLSLPALTSLSLGAQVTDPIYLHQLPALKTLTVDADNPSYSTDGVLLYNKGKTAILGAVVSSEIAATYADYALPSTITSIGKYGMLGAKWLHSFSSDHAFSIAQRALASCPNLTTVVFPDDTTRVGPSSYEDPYPLFSSPVTHLTTPCINDANTVAATLENLTITDVQGASPTYPDVFPNLTEIYFVGNGVKQAAPLLQRADNLAKFRATGLEELIDGSYIPYVMDEQGGLYVNRIGMSTYTGYELLGVSPDLCPSVFEAPRTKEISLAIIGQEAFRGCTSLTQYSSGSGTSAQTEIKQDAFQGCTALTEIHIDNGGDTIIRTGAFDHVTSLQIFATNPSDSYGDITVEENAFLSCGLTMFQAIGKATGSLSSYAFNDCAYLEIVNIQNANFASHSFHDCPAIHTVDLRRIGLFAADTFDEPENITTMNGLSHNGVLTEPKPVGTNLNHVITVHVEGLLAYAMAGFTSVKTLIMDPYSMGQPRYKEVDPYACAGCTSLTSVTLLEGLTTIDQYAFQNCTALPSFTIPASVRTLGDGVFEGCANLRTLYYDGTMAKWETMTKGEGWNTGTKLTQVICSDGVVDL